MTTKPGFFLGKHQDIDAAPVSTSIAHIRSYANLKINGLCGLVLLVIFEIITIKSSQVSISLHKRRITYRFVYFNIEGYFGQCLFQT